MSGTCYCVMSIKADKRTDEKEQVDAEIIIYLGSFTSLCSVLDKSRRWMLLKVSR